MVWLGGWWWRWCGGSIIYTALHQYELCPVPLKWRPGPGTSIPAVNTRPAAVRLGLWSHMAMWMLLNIKGLFIYYVSSYNTTGSVRMLMNPYIVVICFTKWVQVVPETPKTAYVIYEQSRTSSAGEYENSELSNVCGIWCFNVYLRLLVEWNKNMRMILFFTKLWHRKFQISNLRKVSLVKYWVLVQVKKLTKIN